MAVHDVYRPPEPLDGMKSATWQLMGPGGFSWIIWDVEVDVLLKFNVVF